METNGPEIGEGSQRREVEIELCECALGVGACEFGGDDVADGGDLRVYGLVVVESPLADRAHI